MIRYVYEITLSMANFAEGVVLLEVHCAANFSCRCSPLFVLTEHHCQEENKHQILFDAWQNGGTQDADPAVKCNKDQFHEFSLHEDYQRGVDVIKVSFC